MSNEQIWVHGNSAHVQVNVPDWGQAVPLDYALLLSGDVKDPSDQKDVWVHFPIPMPSIVVDGSSYFPTLQKVTLYFSTDCNAPYDYGWNVIESYYVRYKYVDDWGGAFIKEIHIEDGPAVFFKRDFDPLPDNKGFEWQSKGLGMPVEKSLTTDDFGTREIHHGLAVSILVGFKNQMRIQKIKGDFQGAYGPAGTDVSGLAPIPAHGESFSGQPTPVPDFQPEEDPSTRTDVKRAYFFSVGCEYTPAQEPSPAVVVGTVVGPDLAGPPPSPEASIRRRTRNTISRRPK